MACKSTSFACLCWCLVLVCSVGLASAQEESACYGPGSIAASVILSVIFTALLVAALYYLWRRYKRQRGRHLILEQDAEKGKGEYAFDNPGFKETGLTPVTKSLEKSAKIPESGKPKWNQWSPLTALTLKSEKRKTLDDSAIDGNEVKVVALRSHDFTGLGFNICGNMKEGIYIKDVLHRGPASESGKLNPGDRINSVTISFEHMVYEDALTILSYASPYEVIIEARGGKIVHHPSGQAAQPSHPVYRSSSCADLFWAEQSARKRLFGGDDYAGSLDSNYSSLQKSRSNMTTLERKESKSPGVNQTRPKKTPTKSHLSPEQLKIQLEQKILADHQQNLKHKDDRPNKIEAEVQKTENKFQKFGVRVLPAEQKSPKIAELSQNENNVNFEKQPMGIDEVDETPKPQVKKREKKSDASPEGPDSFKRDGSVNGSGIKRDANGIPQEIPSYMLNAAVVARGNRKNSDDRGIAQEDDGDKTPKKLKGKAPPPPEGEKYGKQNLDEIRTLEDVEDISLKPSNNIETGETEVELRQKEPVKDYNSDSDMDADNQSSVNTIELNSSDITIHHSEEGEGRQSRRTASTGDLTNMQKARKTSTGTLERAQSLDITDTSMPVLTKKRKGGRIEDSFDMKSDEDSFGKTMLNKEPRLSLILDGLNTFQRNRLKKSTEWGNLEDAILKLNQEDDSPSSFDGNVSLDSVKFDFGEKSKEFDAVVNKINEIKRESLDMTPVINEENTSGPIKPDKKLKNQIWPSFETTPNSNNAVKPFTSSDETAVRINNKPLLSENNTVVLPKTVNAFNNERSVALSRPNLEESHERRQRKPEQEQDLTPPPLPPVRHVPVTINVHEENNLIPNEKRQRHISFTQDESLLPTETVIVEQELTKPTIPEKKDSLIESRLISSTIYPPTVPEPQDTPPDSIKLQEPSAGIYNESDEIKTGSSYPQVGIIHVNLLDLTSNFIFTERIACSEEDDDYRYFTRAGDTNVSDDIKVSRHSLGSLERPKSDDAKTVDLKLNVSNITINNTPSDNQDNLNSLEIITAVDDSKVSDVSELYTTALDNTVKPEYREDSNKITISTPDIIKNVTITEAINTLNNDVTVQGPSSLTIELPKDMVEIMENKFSTVTNNEVQNPKSGISQKSDDKKNSTEQSFSQDDSDSGSSKNNSSLTYITEIQVLTPNSMNNSNISEIEIIPNTNGRNLDNEFENYVKNFESNVKNFESNIQKFENNLENAPRNEIKTFTSSENLDAEKELHKIQEIAEEQLKKLPEMRFTTSSYESSRTPSEKRQSQIELLRSNFEKSPPKVSKPELTKSRIPIATATKTPPTSPERRDSRNLDMDDNRDILELMSSTVHSTPVVSHSKYQIKPVTKNVTVTSIKSNSKIPSGLPVLGGSSRPPIPPRKYDSGDDHVVQVSTNGGVESSFKQWVFNPTDNSVTNILVSENKQQQK